VKANGRAAELYLLGIGSFLEKADAIL